MCMHAFPSLSVLFAGKVSAAERLENVIIMLS